MAEQNIPLEIVYQDHAHPNEIETIREGIIEEAVKANMGRMSPYHLFVKNAKARIVAGAIGYTMYGLLYIDMLWVDPEFRNRGLGTKLVCAAENLGRERKCTFACLVTMSWQALPLYRRLGYYIEYERLGFENNTIMYLLRKPLV
ncbi:MAG: GNAT family N-acetyltransferase [Chlamydiia bacterium]|nr:GNAT family N-acetyltransferase [Chlamydiia bacterium]